MNQIKERFKSAVMFFAHQNRRSRDLERYKNEMQKYRSMNDEELDYEYTVHKAAYGRKKTELTLISITIAISLIMNIWEKFFKFLYTAFVRFYVISVRQRYYFFVPL